MAAKKKIKYNDYSVPAYEGTALKISNSTLKGVDRNFTTLSGNDIVRPNRRKINHISLQNFLLALNEKLSNEGYLPIKKKYGIEVSALSSTNKEIEKDVVTYDIHMSYTNKNAEILINKIVADLGYAIVQYDLMIVTKYMRDVLKSRKRGELDIVFVQFSYDKDEYPIIITLEMSRVKGTSVPCLDIIFTEIKDMSPDKDDKNNEDEEKNDNEQKANEKGLTFALAKFKSRVNSDVKIITMPEFIKSYKGFMLSAEDQSCFLLGFGKPIHDIFFESEFYMNNVPDVIDPEYRPTIFSKVIDGILKVFYNMSNDDNHIIIGDNELLADSYFRENDDNSCSINSETHVVMDYCTNLKFPKEIDDDLYDKLCKEIKYSDNLEVSGSFVDAILSFLYDLMDCIADYDIIKRELIFTNKDLINNENEEHVLGVRFGYFDSKDYFDFISIETESYIPDKEWLVLRIKSSRNDYLDISQNKDAFVDNQDTKNGKEEEVVETVATMDYKGYTVPAYYMEDVLVGEINEDGKRIASIDGLKCIFEKDKDGFVDIPKLYRYLLTKYNLCKDPNYAYGEAEGNFGEDNTSYMFKITIPKYTNKILDDIANVDFTEDWYDEKKYFITICQYMRDVLKTKNKGDKKLDAIEINHTLITSDGSLYVIKMKEGRVEKSFLPYIEIVLTGYFGKKVEIDEVKDAEMGIGITPSSDETDNNTDDNTATVVDEAPDIPAFEYNGEDEEEKKEDDVIESDDIDTRYVYPIKGINMLGIDSQLIYAIEFNITPDIENFFKNNVIPACETKNGKSLDEDDVQELMNIIPFYFAYTVDHFKPNTAYHRISIRKDNISDIIKPIEITNNNVSKIKHMFYDFTGANNAISKLTDRGISNLMHYVYSIAYNVLDNIINMQSAVWAGKSLEKIRYMIDTECKSGDNNKFSAGISITNSTKDKIVDVLCTNLFKGNKKN